MPVSGSILSPANRYSFGVLPVKETRLPKASYV
jgi:hypothetical protein